MGTKQRSYKGEIVDFNLVKIKSQIQSTTKPGKVQSRELLIKERVQRKLKNVTERIAGKKDEGVVTAISDKKEDITAEKTDNVTTEVKSGESVKETINAETTELTVQTKNPKTKRLRQ